MRALEISSSATNVVICVRNEGYELDLKPMSDYEVVPDDSLEPDDIRVKDDTGEDYIYPASYFVSLQEAASQIEHSRPAFQRNAVVTEPTPERLQEMKDRFGFSEQEARIFVYLQDAEKLLQELIRERSVESSPGSPMPRLGSIIWKETHIHEHFSALRRELGMSVLSRKYPKGWGYVPPENEDQN